MVHQFTSIALTSLNHLLKLQLKCLISLKNPILKL